MTTTSAQALTSSLNKLRVSSEATPTSKKPSQLVDSWEDDADDSSPVQTTTPENPLSSPLADLPEAPPTSPVSPSVRTRFTSTESPFQTFPPYGMTFDSERETTNKPSKPDHDRRPDTSTSVASRLIAAGIGQKAPRRTQEQKEYDQAMKMQEKRRRDAARDEALKAQQDKETAKRAIWED